MTNKEESRAEERRVDGMLWYGMISIELDIPSMTYIEESRWYVIVRYDIDRALQTIND